MKLLDEGDVVEVKHSKSGYTGPGTLVSLAYGNNWLVKINAEPGKNSLIMVNTLHLDKLSDGIVRDNKKKKFDPKDSVDPTEDFDAPRDRKKKRR
jgi:hypothetical protein